MNQLEMIKEQFKNMQAAAAGQQYVAPAKLLRKEMVTKPITSQAEARVVLNRIHAATPTPAKTNEQATVTVTPGNPRQADALDIARLFFPPALLFGIGRSPVGSTPPPTVNVTGTPEAIKKLDLIPKEPTPSPQPQLPSIGGGGIGEALDKAGGMMDKIMLVAVILSVVGLGSKVLGFIGGNK